MIHEVLPRLTPRSTNPDRDCPMPEVEAAGPLIFLLRAARSRDSGATEVLLRRLYPALSRYARRRLSGLVDAHDVADDVTQEAMIRIARGLHQTRAATDAQLIGWSLSILRNTIHDHFRLHPPGDEPIRLTMENEAWIDPAFSPSWDVVQPPTLRTGQVLTRLVREVCSALPSHAIYLLHLRLERRAIWEDIAVELGTTPAGAKRRFQRLQTTLRKRILQNIDLLSPTDQTISRRKLRLDHPGLSKHTRDDEYTL